MILLHLDTMVGDLLKSQRKVKVRKQQDGRAQQYHTFIQAILSFELCKPSLLNK
jgi:hypothetical protein